MLRRAIRKSPPSGKAFASTSAGSRPSTTPGAPGTPDSFPFLISQFPTREGRRLDITFHDRFLKPAPQMPVMSSISRMRDKDNVRKAIYRNLPNVEKQRLYLESRPLKQKLLDWVGSKSRALVRTQGTVDAWTGWRVQRAPVAKVRAGDVKMLSSGEVAYVKPGMSNRAKRVMALGMMISFGALMGWSLLGFSGSTRAEGPPLVDEPAPKKKKVVPLVPVEEQEKRPGVFVWGSNRYVWN